MAASLNVKYLGNLDCECTHLPSGDKVRSNPPVDNHGRGDTFSPTDLFLAGLATCMLTTIGNNEKKYGCDVSGMEIDVDKSMQASPRQVGSVRVEMRMPDRAYTPEQKAAITRDVHECAICRSMNPDISLEIIISWQQ